MKQEDNTLQASKVLDIRFSEVDSMHIVWHGSYMLYFEDAREAFGEKYGLSYAYIRESGCYAPLVEISFKYKRPLTLGMKPRVIITYRPCAAAKVQFDYEIVDDATGQVCATGHSVQVFMDLDYQLLWDNPDFFVQWKKKWNV